MVEKSKTIEVSGLIFPGAVQQSRDHETQLLSRLALDFPVRRSDAIAGSGDESSQYSLVDRRGLRTTSVIFFGDNSQAHVRDKQFCYDSGLLVPLIICWSKNFSAPKHFQPGSVDDRLLAAIDLAPTMLGLARIPKPARMQGEILLGEHAPRPRKYVFGARDRCDETVFRFRTVRGTRYRYIRNFTPERPFLQPNE